jgi:3-hydroxyacyl-CoA dehydrogenase/3a,7a,12a-trihydroxy-5b-cholest-24-enoyl-CoA hydratase
MVADDVRDAAFTAALERNLDPALVAPVVAWLCHPDCTDNGETYQAFAGRFARTALGEFDGFWDFAPTVESVAAGLAKLPTRGEVIRAADSSSRAQAVVAEAQSRRAAGLRTQRG